MNKLLILSALALMLPVVPALACFPDDSSTSFAFDEDRSFTRAPLPMSYCESGEAGFVIVDGKCYDQDAITDYDTEEECDADPVCKAYFEQQTREAREKDFCEENPEVVPCNPNDAFAPPTPEPEPSPPEECSHEGLGPDVCRPIDQGDPNHGEIKGDEELEDEEEHQEEEEQGQEQGEPKETGETAE